MGGASAGEDEAALEMDSGDVLNATELSLQVV